ncbi:beta-lactamase family protein [Actinoplanes sp. NBC_00393]|uniref:serine hydrolase domain-containing protein n=1 Tax=Actinoplanes sp. NBC_00393 TaxID=2975953 RepID=UPI002E1CBCC1
MNEMLQRVVSSGAAPHIAGMAADRGGVIYEGAAGPVTVDSVFRIASMTKMICTVAALQLRDSGDLDFSAPVEAYCGDFASVQVLENNHLRTPNSRATVHQLVTHTSGLSYGFWNAALAGWDDDLFTAPMVADPGTTFEYGISTDWLGRVIEAVSGQSLDKHLAEHILTPLGMDSTTFVLDEEQRARCVPVHVKNDDGTWSATDFDWDQQPGRFAGGHGLYSTPRDYLRFQRMLLGGGTPILDPATVREAFRNQIGDLWFPATIRTADPAWSCDFRPGSGMKWGWGLLLNTIGQPGMRSAGSGGWAGAFNTFFWIDPAAGITGALYMQTLPFLSPDALRVYADFERAVYARKGDR